MKNILIVAPDFYPNNTGFANASVNLIKAVRKYDNSINFLVYTSVPLRGSNEFEHAQVFRSKYKGIIYARKQFKEICRIVEQFHVDFIMFETNTFISLQDLVLKKYKDKVGVRIHSTADTEAMLFYNELTGLKGKIVRRSAIKFMQKCNIIICTNTYHQHFVFEHFYNNNVYLMWSKEHYLLPNTVDVECNPKDGPYLLSLGKLSYDGFLQKGLFDFLCALRLIKCKGIDFKAKIVGDGPYRENVERLIDVLELKDRVILIPRLAHNEVIDLICNSKAVCLLSRFEGQSMFATEALACGKPLVLTVDNGMHDMLEEGVNGYAARTGDVDDIANKIELILSKDTNSLLSMGLKSRDIFDKKFSEKSICDRFSNMLKMVENVKK